MNYFIGIDVGTGSARAGLFDASGHLLSHASRAIELFKPKEGFAEQSSEEIWAAICKCIQEIIESDGVDAREVKGIGFDATCSLVLVDAEDQPVSVSPTGEQRQNVIVWMDHRAVEETELINHAGDFPVYDYVGGKISLEMQTPKLLWLKRHLPESWSQAAHFFDLPDYLTYRATGIPTRSLCSTTCKWTYLPQPPSGRPSGWQEDFLAAIGLEEFSAENYARIGQDIQPMGEPIGKGLNAQAAKELGLIEGTPVGVSIIDAHAGGIGMIGMKIDGIEPSFDKRLALIGGTSSCHMTVSENKRHVPGVWGPYYSAMIPGLWLNEGGQSATGALVDHIIFNHAAYPQALAQADEKGVSIYERLNDLLAELAKEKNMGTLTRELHLCPYFHGNRSPRADPRLVGMVSGLRLSAGVEDLALQYLATIQAIAYGTRHILETMNAQGYAIEEIVCCGGGIKNPVFLQQHADITGCRLILPQEPEAVLLGSAMLGAVASGQYPTVVSAMATMSRPGKTIEPNADTASFHQRKYEVFHQLYEHQMTYQQIMGEA